LLLLSQHNFNVGFSKIMVENKASVIIKEEHVAKGILASLGAIVAGVVLWVILWRMGFVASIVSFAIAWLAIKLYGLGAGMVTRSSAKYIVAVSIVGVALSFLAGLVSDGADVFADGTKLSLWNTFTAGDFWSFIWANFQSAELWKSYTGDIAMAALFAALGMFWTLKDLFKPAKPAAEAKK
jgi:hypothetical protein